MKALLIIGLALAGALLVGGINMYTLSLACLVIELAGVGFIVWSVKGWRDGYGSS